MKSKVVLITGSSRGIGAATARLASSLGSTVILHGKSESPALLDLAKELRTEFITCDVADKSAVQKSVEEIVNKNKKIDVLVNNAGIVKFASSLESQDEHWIEHYQVNVLGALHFCQAVIPHMQNASQGSIVNVASMRGLRSLSTGRIPAYSASKAAMINMSSSLAKDYAPQIRINALCPGFTLTDNSNAWNEQAWEQAQSSLLERVAQPEEIAEAILFLASDKASFITGQVLTVDGGYEISDK